MEGAKGIHVLQAEEAAKLEEAGAQLVGEAGSSYSEDQAVEGGQGQQAGKAIRLEEAGAQLVGDAGSSYSDDRASECGQSQLARTQSPPAMSKGSPGRTESRNMPEDNSAKSERAKSEAGRPWHDRYGSGRPWPRQRKQQKDADKAVEKLWESMLTHPSQEIEEPTDQKKSDSLHSQPLKPLRGLRLKKCSNDTVTKPLSNFDGRGRPRTKSPAHGSAPASRRTGPPKTVYSR